MSNGSPGPLGFQKQNKKSDNVTEQLTDEELANLPRVRNIFNKFWKEKMMELNKGENKERSKEGQAQSNFVKSPSDTTIYAPAIAKGSQGVDYFGVNNGVRDVRGHEQTRQNRSTGVDVNHLISNFVDNVRMEQKQSEMNDSI